MKNPHYREPTVPELKLAVRILALALRRGNAQPVEVVLAPQTVQHEVLLDKRKHSLLIKC